MGFWCLWWIFSSGVAPERDNSQFNNERLHCRQGFYCPPESFSPVPCPKGTYGPDVGAVSVESCLKCPSHYYCPRPGMFSPLTCGPLAQQPLSGQHSCTSNEEVCVEQLYSVCRDGRSRTQYGDCFDKQQWSSHCRREVCQTAEDYRGYDRELGLCVCRDAPGRAMCGGLCRRKMESDLKLQCGLDGDLELVWSYESQVSDLSGGVLETVFKKWDSQGNLQCNSQNKSSRPVYIVQTTEAGFFGLLGGIPKEIHQLFPDSTHSSADKENRFLHEVEREEDNIPADGEVHLRESDVTEENKMLYINGVLNPTTCLHLGDILLFIVNTLHYPFYDVDNLYNTNSHFDWGAFRLLKEELTLSWTPPAIFTVVFSQPGVYVFTLSSNQHKHMYVRVMPAGGQCYEPGPFFPTLPRHVTRMGIRRRRDLLLRPDWLVAGGLLFGAVIVLCLCVAVLIMFREYGWPQKETIRARYRSLQLSYQMDDYSSKGSRVISLRKTHRKQQAGVTQDSMQPVACADASDEFWDYEHQVDLEAFSSNTFYSLLLKQSLSVTTRLGQLTTEVHNY